MSSLILAGDTSGTITLTVPTAAGTNTITLPALTGTAITTASTSGIPNTINWTTVQTSSVNPAVAGTGYPMNTTSGALTVTLPASPTAGNMISIVDYAGTFATNNLTVNPNGNKIQGNTNNATLSTNREAVNLVYVDSTQGWLPYSDVYSTGNPIPVQYTASYLVVAGGGSGGRGDGAGGGAGGAVTGTISLVNGTTYTATVGAGGAAKAGTPGIGNSGSNSTFPGVTTAVGGGAGCNGAAAGGSGGSGGGGNPGGAGTPGQGNNGGGHNGGNGSGGGGGAGFVGQTQPGVNQGGTGGTGIASSITGSPSTYAGGGGGGGGPGSTPAAGGTNGGPAGSPGGGATGSMSPGVVPTAATVNTGGGGGGGNAYANDAGSGGSGVVILSVPTSSYPGTTTGSPTITTSGGNTIIKFTGSGTYTA